MPRGGSRSGAGRKKGQRAKATQIRQAMIAKAAHNGLSPLDYMLQVMRDETAEKSARFQAAIEAAPYVHPKLANTTLQGDPDNPVQHEHEIRWKILDPRPGSST